MLKYLILFLSFSVLAEPNVYRQAKLLKIKDHEIIVIRNDLTTEMYSVDNLKNVHQLTSEDYEKLKQEFDLNTK